MINQINISGCHCHFIQHLLGSNSGVTSLNSKLYKQKFQGRYDTLTPPNWGTPIIAAVVILTLRSVIFLDLYSLGSLLLKSVL